jgi:hypothetical protein
MGNPGHGNLRSGRSVPRARARPTYVRWLEILCGRARIIPAMECDPISVDIGGNGDDHGVPPMVFGSETPRSVSGRW